MRGFASLCWLSLALWFAVGTADAADPDPVAKFPHAGKEVLIYRVGEVIRPVASDDVLASDLAPVLRNYTVQSGFEVCALLCKSADGSSVGAVVTTVRSAAACPVAEICPDGMAPSGSDIHSHIHAGTYEPTQTDALFLMKAYARGQKVQTYPEAFSSGDFESGLGYLVTPTKLLHQSGRRRIRKVTVSP